MPYSFPYNDLFIADEDFEQSSQSVYRQYALSAEKYWSDIVLLISHIREEGVLEGTSAKFIEEFASELHNKFENSLEEIISGTDGLTKNMQEYVDNVESADDCLY